MLFVTHDIDESVYMSDRVVILTSSPSHVQEVLPIDLPRPRTQDGTKALPEFATLRTHVYRDSEATWVDGWVRVQVRIHLTEVRDGHH